LDWVWKPVGRHYSTGGASCKEQKALGEYPNTQLKEAKNRKGDRRAWMPGTMVLLNPEAVIGPYEDS
jgi:hypothetical protein